MARDISIAIAAKDMFSPTVNSMRNALSAFDKDAEESARVIQNLEKKQDSLRGSQSKLQATLDGVSKALKDEKKDYKGLDDAAGTENLEKLHRQYLDTKDAIKQFGDEAKRTQKEIVELSAAQSRTENRAGGSTLSGGTAGGETSMMGRLAGAGIGKMFGDALSGAAMTGISSAFGSNAGDAISTMLSGTLSGAAMGSIAGPVGTAIGGAVGTVTGGIGAATQLFQKEDDAFRGVVQGRSENALNSQEEEIISGSTIAAKREQTQLAFQTLLGSEDAASVFLDEARGMAASTPFSEDDITRASQLLKTAYDTDDIFEVITVLGDTRSALGKSMQDMEMWISSLTRMKQTDKTSLELLNFFTDRGVNVVDYLAQARGATTAQIFEDISKGNIRGSETADIIIQALGKSSDEGGYAGGMELQAKSFLGIQSSLEDARNGIYATASQAYNGIIQEDMEAEIAMLNGETGVLMKEAYSEIAKSKAELEASKGRMEREAIEAVLTGEAVGSSFTTEGNRNRLAEMAEEYKQEGANKGMLLAEAETIAIAEYEASEGFQSMKGAQLTLIESVRNDTELQDEYWNTGITMGNKFSEGLAAAAHANKLFSPGYLTPETNDLTNPDMVITSPAMTDSGEVLFGPSPEILNGHAYGLPYVPRDDYLARLHEGERVLTAAQAREYRAGGAPVTVQMNGATIREEADIYKIAQALAEELRRAQQVS